jgi:hypothetical protein
VKGALHMFPYFIGVRAGGGGTPKYWWNNPNNVTFVVVVVVVVVVVAHARFMEKPHQILLSLYNEKKYIFVQDLQSMF